MTTNHPVVWFEVLGQDGEKLQKYYADLFGWNITVGGPGKYGEVKAGPKGSGAGSRRSIPARGPG